MLLSKKSADLCSGPILPNMLALTLPLMLSGILQMLFTAADTVVIGNFGSEHSLAAVGSTGGLTGLFVMLFIGLSVGSNAVCARCIGSDDEEGTSQALHTSILFGLITGACLTALILPLADDLLRLMQTPENVIGLSTVYLRIYSLGIIPTLVYNFATAVLRSKGDTRRPMYYLTIAGITNVLLNLLFVIVLKMDVAGVALATIISQSISALLTILALMRETGACRLHIRRLRLHKASMREILRIGLPAGLQGLINSLGGIAIQSCTNTFGPIVMAGFAASGSVLSLFWAGANAFAYSTLTLVSQNYGAKKYSRINRILLTSSVSVTVFAAATGLLFYLFAAPLIGLYDSRPEVVEVGITAIRTVCAFYFFGGIMDCASFASRGLGYSLPPMFVATLGQTAMRFIWAFGVLQLPKFHTVPMLAFSDAVVWTVTCAAQLVCFFLVRRKFPKTDLAT